jgi:orotate phosphoribosyltransferase
MRAAVVAILTTLCVVGIQYAVRYVIGGWNVDLLVALAVGGMTLALAVAFNEHRKERARALRSAPTRATPSRERDEP